MLLEVGRTLKQWSNFYKLDKGFVLMDALLGLFVLSTALVAIGAAYTQTTIGVMHVNDNAHATYLAKQALEAVKQNDRLKQANNNFALPANYTQSSSDGIKYTISYSSPTITEDLGTAAACIKPVQVVVSWTDRLEHTTRTFTAVEYCYLQPTITVATTYSTSYVKHKNHFYDDMDTARTHSYAGDVSGDGWFYTPKSVVNQLWSHYFSTKYDLTTDNRAVSTAWGASSQKLEFYDMTFPTINTGQYAYLQFEIRNDAAAGEENTAGVVRDENEWGLASGSTVFLFDIYVNGKTVATGVEVKASDTAYNSPDTTTKTGTVTTDGIQLNKYLNTGTTAVQDIQIVWTNDTGDKTYNNGSAGTDANASIRNISLTVK